MNDHYADPLREAAAQGVERTVQMTSVAAAAGQVLTQIKAQRLREQAEHDRQATAALRARQQVAYQAARLQWAPASDPRWLRTADFLGTARAWGAAVPYAPSDSAAERARLRCEQRLRELHPYGMSRYDRLRTEGLGPVEAMRKAAPFFARVPNPRTGYAAPVRKELSTAVTLGTQDFPVPIKDVVRTTDAAQAAQAAKPTPRPTQNLKP
ncbi:hypothetical protein [Microtetraspora sp. NBRC 16547]|uniref:hypothetical protein n=1 Tax=Microtetraspora sp. NBRC 16547 TaxID=3030993 RepID=UPI0024A29AC7|nr:hypothetical protein [Microtetraspora sp. NBRC 16547]GLX02647.1 hypothetical protein Misp02_67330 [Microtetraspora sp. NBRC 16547]